MPSAVERQLVEVFEAWRVRLHVFGRPVSRVVLWWATSTPGNAEGFAALYDRERLIQADACGLDFGRRAGAMTPERLKALADTLAASLPKALKSNAFARLPKAAKVSFAVEWHDTQTLEAFQWNGKAVRPTPLEASAQLHAYFRDQAGANPLTRKLEEVDLAVVAEPLRKGLVACANECGRFLKRHRNEELNGLDVVWNYGAQALVSPQYSSSYPGVVARLQDGDVCDTRLRVSLGPLAQKQRWPAVIRLAAALAIAMEQSVESFRALATGGALVGRVRGRVGKQDLSLAVRFYDERGYRSVRG